MGVLRASPPYYPLGGGSPAIDRIPAGDCSFISSDVGNPLFDMNAIMTTDQRGVARDRKSTRLNSSHTVISYAVFCLRKEKHTSELQSHSDLVCRLLLENEIVLLVMTIVH